MATIVLTPEELEARIKAGLPVQALITDPAEALAVMTAGEAYVSFKSVQSGTHYTYLIEKGKVREGDTMPPPFFVKYLIGQDNTSDYTYLGWIIPDRFKNGQIRFLATKKTKNPNSQVFKAFQWAWDKFMDGIMPVGLEVWNSGHCARCHRLLTNPKSISDGFGPECIKHGVGLNAMKAEAAKMLAVAAPVVATPVAAKPFTPKPTPASIVAAVTEDPKIKQMADALWATHPANPVNAKPVVAAEPLPVDQKAAEALAKSQGWTVDEAVLQLGRRKVVNMNLAKKTPSKAELVLEGVEVIKTTHDKTYPASATEYTVKQGEPPFFIGEQALKSEVRYAELSAKVEELKNSSPDKFTMDGIMSDEEAFNFWYRRFANDSSPVEV